MSVALSVALGLLCTVRGLLVQSAQPLPGFQSRRGGFKSSRRYLVDPVGVLVEPVTTQAGVLDAAISAALTTFSSRVGGAIIGNVLAAIVIKTVSDVVRSKSQPERELARREQQEQAIPVEAWVKLLFCVLIDVVGDSSFFLPGIGELEDVVWAPMSSLALKVLFDSNAIAVIDFIKEALPGTDFVPVATLSWAILYLLPSQNPLTRALGLQRDNNQRDISK